MQKIICIIDDDPLFQHLTKRLIGKVIQEQGYQLLQFENGKIAIDYFKQYTGFNANLPQLVFVDINMPVLNGWQFLDEFSALQLKGYFPDIYMASSSSDKADLDKACSYKELKGYLMKPIGASQLSTVISSVYGIA